MFDFKSLRLKEDQNVVVTSNTGKFYGKFKKIAMNGMRLDLAEVKSSTGEKCGFKFFFQNNVQFVQVLDKQSLKQCEKNQPNSSSTKVELSSQLTEKQWNQIANTIKSCLLIQQRDSRYIEALDDISKQYVVGIVSEGTSKGRIYDMHLLAISTDHKIYIFDGIRLDSKTLMNDMKEIFESNEMVKVVYDCRGIKDNFREKFNVQLEAFDLMLIAAQYYPKLSVLTLSSCVEAVLGVKDVVKDHEIALKRPISQEALHSITVKVAFHIAMYHKLVQKTLMLIYKNPIEALTGEHHDAVDLVDTLSSRKRDNVLNQKSLIGHIKKVNYKIYENDLKSADSGSD